MADISAGRIQVVRCFHAPTNRRVSPNPPPEFFRIFARDLSRIGSLQRVNFVHFTLVFAAPRVSTFSRLTHYNHATFLFSLSLLVFEHFQTRSCNFFLKLVESTSSLGIFSKISKEIKVFSSLVNLLYYTFFFSLCSNSKQRFVQQSCKMSDFYNFLKFQETELLGHSLVVFAP